MLHDVGVDVEEVSLALDRDEGTLGSVVLRDLWGLGERTERLDIALDAHVAEHKERGADGRLSECRVAGDEERDAHFGFDPIREQVDDLDVYVGVVEVARDAHANVGGNNGDALAERLNATEPFSPLSASAERRNAVEPFPSAAPTKAEPRGKARYNCFMRLRLARLKLLPNLAERRAATRFIRPSP